MGPHAVVVEPPGFDCLAGLREAHQPVLIEALVSKLAIEALDEAVLYRLAWTDESELDAVAIGPLIECPAGE